MEESRYLWLGLAIVFSFPAYAKPIDIVFKLKERKTITELAQSVQDPTSPRYNVFYTPEEIRELSAPSESEYNALIQELKSEGFRIIKESKSHLYLTVRADHTLVESVFQTSIRFVRSGPRGAYTPPLIPAQLKLIETLTGLDATPRMRHRMRFLYRMDDTGQTGIPQETIKSAYGFDPLYAEGLSGNGQHIAIATYDGFHMDDINGFFVQSKFAKTPKIDQVIFNGTPAVNEDSAAETELDAEFSGMIAPGAQIHIFASAQNSDAGEVQLMTAILDDNRAKIVNYSWGTCETSVSAQHQSDMDALYARAIAQGVNIMVASGDSGADGCQDGTQVADWPASSPNVVAVGGTSFAMNGSALAETGWTDSGGGVSQLYKKPNYQASFQAPFTMRSIPDVAFNADPATGEAIWTQYQTGTAHWMVVGGTSMAAPQWSGFMALVGEARITHGKGPIGQLNPILYGIPGKLMSSYLHDDVTSGSNGYPAGAGWNAVTGWGSMQADALLGYLSAH